MTANLESVAGAAKSDESLSLFCLLDPKVLANPYPLYDRLRTEDPVHWDAFLHAWIVTRHADVLHVLHSFSANRSPSPEQLEAMGLSAVNPIAQIMVRQMLFMDAPAHTRLRSLASAAFTQGRVAQMRSHIQGIADSLIDAVVSKERLDVISDFAAPLPAIVTAEMLGVPVADHDKLKNWSIDFAEMFGNFQHNPNRFSHVLRSVDEMTSYFRSAMHEQRERPREGLVTAFMTAEIEGARLSEEEIIANLIVTMVGGQETTTNLIGNGLLTLLRHPDQLAALQQDFGRIPAAIDEMLRYESPIQHTVRLAPADVTLNGKQIHKRQAVMAVMGAANRDPERFPDPGRFDIGRKDNRHLAFGAGAHTCFGAPLARLEGQIAFETIFRRLPNLRLESAPLVWRYNLGFRGLDALPVSFGSSRRD